MGDPPSPPPPSLWQGKPWVLGVGGNYVWCLVIVVYLWDLKGQQGEARKVLESLYGVGASRKGGGGGVLNIYGGELFSLAPCITNIYQHLMKSSLIALNIVFRMNSVSLCSILFGMYYLIVLRILFEMNLPMNPRDLNHLVNSLSEISWA